VNGKSVWVAELAEVRAGKWFFRTLRVGDRWATYARYPNFDPQDPLKGGWLFAQWWGEPWERGAFNEGVSNIHHVGDRLEWQMRVPASGRYRVWVRYAHNMKAFGIDRMDDRTGLRVNESDLVPLRNLPDTGGWGNFRWALAAELSLPAGEVTLVWENVKGGGLNLDAFVLTDDENWHPERAIRLLGWWGEYQLDPPQQGKHVLLIQAEACTKAVGREIRIAHPRLPGSHTRIAVAKEHFPNWRNLEGAEVHLFPAWGWVNAILTVEGVDSERGILFVQCEQEIRPGNRFFISGVREALDAPNEWHLDRKTGELVYIAPPKVVPTKAEIVAPRMDRLFVLQGDPKANRFVEHIHFRDLIFTDTDYTAPGGYYVPADAAIWLVAARRCRVEGCEFRWLGGYAVRLEQRSHENAIVGNTMHHLGGGGVIMLGNTATQPFNNTVTDNTITDCGLVCSNRTIVGLKPMLRWEEAPSP